METYFQQLLESAKEVQLLDYEGKIKGFLSDEICYRVHKIIDRKNQERGNNHGTMGDA